MFDEPFTLGNEQRDFVEWHRGRRPYVVWGLEVSGDQLASRLETARHCLDGLLLPDYVRQPHVTIEICGFPASGTPGADEFDADFLQAQLDALRAADLAPFEVEIGKLDSFSSAPYLAVADQADSIPVIRRALAVSGCNRLDWHYLPHVTVGLYAHSWPAAQVHRRLAAFPDLPSLRLRIGGLTLMGYEPGVIGGALTPLAEFDLARRRMAWLGEPLFHPASLARISPSLYAEAP